MKITIRNPERVFFQGFAKEAILPGEDGEFSVWDFHQGLMATLKKGNVILSRGKDMPLKSIEIDPGVMTLDRNELIILCL